MASIDEGHEFQELIDLQDAAGGSPVYFPKQEWLTYELDSFDRDALPPESELAGNQGAKAFELTEGTDAVYLGASGPNRLWFCAPLEVTTPAG